MVWGLIFYASWRFRRRSDDEIPIQTRYNLPLEIFYTIFPIVMVVVFFSHTVQVQNLVLDDSPPDNTVVVVGQQWSWTFNHPDAVDGAERLRVRHRQRASRPWSCPSTRPPASSCAPPT